MAVLVYALQVDVMLCLQKEFSLDDIRELDVAIYEFQTLYLEVYGKEGWLPKFNFAQHFPLDILKYVAIHRAQTNLPHTPRRVAAPLSAP